MLEYYWKNTKTFSDYSSEKKRTLLKTMNKKIQKFAIP